MRCRGGACDWNGQAVCAEERQGGLLLHSLLPLALPLSLLSTVAVRTVGVQITETLLHLLQLKMPERYTGPVS